VTEVSREAACTRRDPHEPHDWRGWAWIGDGDGNEIPAPPLHCPGLGDKP